MFRRGLIGASLSVGGLKLFSKNSTNNSTNVESNETKSRRKIVLDGYSLKQVQILIRHGARTPIHTMKNIEEAGYNNSFVLGSVPLTEFNYTAVDLDGNEKPFSTYDAHYAKKDKLLKDGGRRGILTKYGQYQMYDIGKSIGQQYIEEAGFIDPVFNPSQFYIRSTNIARTIATARCVIGGMFSSQNLSALKEPVKIHIEDSKLDSLLPRTAVCHVLRQINHFAMIHGGDLPGLREDRLLVESILGMPPSKHKINFIDVRDDIVARETHGYVVPESLKPHRQMIEDNASKVMYYAFCAHEEAEREVAMQVSTGPLVHLLLNNIEQADKSGIKMYLYSCHDSTLVGLLGVLDIYDFKWPPFGADVRFELYENKEGQRFVRVSYNGKDQIIRGCNTELCSVDEFKQNLKPYSLDEKSYKELCSSNILEIIAQEMLEQEKDEVEDEEDTERSDTPAGM